MLINELHTSCVNILNQMYRNIEKYFRTCRDLQLRQVDILSLCPSLYFTDIDLFRVLIRYPSLTQATRDYCVKVQVSESVIYAMSGVCDWMNNNKTLHVGKCDAHRIVVSP